jgi:hypothetical protein
VQILTHFRLRTKNPNTLLSESQQIFASKYLLYLPSEAELKTELERERHLAELKLKDSDE